MKNVHIVHKQTVVVQVGEIFFSPIEWELANGSLWAKSAWPKSGPQAEYSSGPVYVCTTPAPTCQIKGEGKEKNKDRKERGRRGRKREEHATETLRSPKCLKYLKSDPLQNSWPVPATKHYTEVKRTSSTKTLKGFYLWFYILTRAKAKRKCEADLFHVI